MCPFWMNVSFLDECDRLIFRAFRTADVRKEIFIWSWLKVVIKPSSPVFFTIAQARPGHTAEWVLITDAVAWQRHLTSALHENNLLLSFLLYSALVSWDQLLFALLRCAVSTNNNFYKSESLVSLFVLTFLKLAYYQKAFSLCLQSPKKCAKSLSWSRIAMGTLFGDCESEELSQYQPYLAWEGILLSPCPFWIRFCQLNFFQKFPNFFGGENWHQSGYFDSSLSLIKVALREL